MANQAEHQQPAPKKPRLVFTDLQRRTLQAIFKVSSARARIHAHIHIRIHTERRTHVHTTCNFLPLVIDSNCPLLLRPLADMHRQLNIERARYHRRRRLIRRLLAATNFRGRKRIVHTRARTCTRRARLARTPVPPSAPVDRRFLKTSALHGGNPRAAPRRVNPRVGNRWYTQSRSYVRASRPGF